MKKFQTKALILCEVEEVTAVFLGNLQGNSIPREGHWISLLWQSSKIFTGPSLSEKVGSVGGLWGIPSSPGLHDAKCYHKGYPVEMAVLILATFAMSSESEPVLFLLHSLSPTFFLLILNSDVAGKRDESWGWTSALGAENQILSLSPGAGWLLTSWEGGPGFRKGKFGLCLQGGQYCSVWHHVEGEKEKETWIFRES